MNTIVAIFASAAEADQAVQRLLNAGVPGSDIHLHEKGRPARNAAGVVADEYMTGGFFANFMGLLDGLLEARRDPNVATSYADVVQHEGVALSVETAAARAPDIEALLRSQGASKVSRSDTDTDAASA